MSILWNYFSQQRLLLSVWMGRVDLEDCRRHALELAALPGVLHIATRLTEVSQAEISFDSLELQSIAEYYSPTWVNPLQRLAIVAGRNFEAARMYESILSKQMSRTIVFNSLHPACTWLGLDTFQMMVALRALRKSAMVAER